MLKEHYRERTTRILMVGLKEHSRKEQRRRAYIDKHGNRYIRSMGLTYHLNADNEWRQQANDMLRSHCWNPYP